MIGTQIPSAAIADTVAAVLSDPAYQRVALIHRLGAWLLGLIRSLLARFRPGPVPPAVFWILVIAVACIVLLAAGRAIRGLGGGRRSGRPSANGGPGTGPSNPWHVAGLLAAKGEYTSAAHQLYAGLLEGLAGRGIVELHESKTAGDYRRDLTRSRSSARLGFRDFSTQYELAIYGLGSCDRERYDLLHGLARRIVDTGA